MAGEKDAATSVLLILISYASKHTTEYQLSARAASGRRRRGHYVHAACLTRTTTRKTLATKPPDLNVNLFRFVIHFTTTILQLALASFVLLEVHAVLRTYVDSIIYHNS